MDHKIKIVVIDDDCMALSVFRNALREFDYDVRIYSDPVSGLKDIKSIIPDVIFLDVVMPGHNGNKILKILKADTLTQHIPVIMLTGKDKIQDIQISFEYGAVDYIVKPFDKNILHLRLLNILRKKL